MNDAAASLLPHMLLFALVCGALLVLPFVPAWREWQHPSDSAALPVSQSLTSDTGFLAPQLEADLGAFEASFEKGFGLQETIFDAGIELLGHA